MENFENWQKKAREVYMSAWIINPITVVYDPSKEMEYNAFEKGISPEEFVKLNYLDVFFIGL